MTKPPPLLLGAALLFWGWQAGFLPVAIIIGFILEAPRWINARWDVTQQDFQRIWTFCTLLLLAALVYSFTANDGPAEFRGLIQNPSYHTQRDAGASSARTAASVISWLPMLFALFMAAQVYSSKSAVPLETISLILRRRWRKARKSGRAVPVSQYVDVSYVYFGICLLASSVHRSDNTTFFWGVSVLVPWALWPLRVKRYGIPVWSGAMVVVIALGYYGQRGITEVSRQVVNWNAQWLARFARGRFDASQTRTDIGRLGRLKMSPRIVLRLETKPGTSPPPVLREASYRTFKAASWFAETGTEGFEAIQQETNQTTWVLLPAKTNELSLTIACYLGQGLGSSYSALLPLPHGASRLENLPVYLMSKNQLGAIQAEGPGLVIFDALYGPGETIDSPPSSSDNAIPGRELQAISQIADELQLAQLPYEQVRHKISRFFSANFSYSVWRERGQANSRFGRDPDGQTALGRFLVESRQGHCEYFATATVLLLRKSGIPARYAVGYAVHEPAGNNKYVVRQRDAHAWALAWNEGTRAWENLDTTPGSWIHAEAARASSFEFLKDVWSRVVFEISKLRWGQTHLRRYLFWALLPILTILLYQIIFRRRKRHPVSAATLYDEWPGLDSEFYSLISRIERMGIVRQSGETLLNWLSRATREPELAGSRDALQQLLWLHYRYRFDPNGLDEKERQTLRQHARDFLARMQRVRHA